MPDEFETLFGHSQTPAPRAGLTDRIVLATTEQSTPPAPVLSAANDRQPYVWTALAGIAATLVAGFFVFTSQPSEADLWAQQADNAGFGELYSWVNEAPD